MNRNMYEYRKADAFTSDASLGNPAACLYLGEGQSLSPGEMLSIAKQHKGFVSEIVFCTRENDGSSFSLTYYSSECEVDFCGHGTIACMYGLIKETPALLYQRELQIYTNRKGALTVFNEIPEHDSVFISAPAPEYIGLHVSIPDVAENLQMRIDQISTIYPVEIIDAGLKTLIIPTVSLEDEMRVFPGEQALKAFCLRAGVDIVLIYSLKTDNPENIAHTRVFAPKFGYLEDPATGSGNSAFGYYMIRHKLWDGGHATVEQGGIDRVFNAVHLSCKNDRVLFGGKATTRIEGVYYI